MKNAKKNKTKQATKTNVSWYLPTRVLYIKIVQDT